MNTNINFTHFRFATPYFESRQEMFDFLEQIPEEYDCYNDFISDNSPEMFSFLERERDYSGLDRYFGVMGKVHLLNLIEIEVTEALWKTASEVIKKKDEAIKNYNKLKELLHWVKNVKQTCNFKYQISLSYTCFRMGRVYYEADSTHFFNQYQWLNYHFFNPKYSRFEEKIGRIEAENENKEKIETSYSLNDEFKMLEYAQAIEIALAELKAKMGL